MKKARKFIDWYKSEDKSIQWIRKLKRNRKKNEIQTTDLEETNKTQASGKYMKE